MNLRHLLRMSRLARRPPGERQVLFVLGVIALCVLLFAVERMMGGWPAALTPSWSGRPPSIP